MRNILLLLTFCFILFEINLCAQKNPSERRINRIHENAITIDSHTDTPMWFLDKGFSFGQYHDSRLQHSKIDIPRMDIGGLDGIFLAVFIGQQERDEAGNQAAKDEAIEVFDSIYSCLARYPDKIELALQPDDINSILAKEKHAVFIGLENGYPIGKDISMIDTFYNMGARYITLCHTSNNDICTSSTDKNPESYSGLSEFGKRVVRKMNEKGIMIDISHVSDSAFYDVIKLSDAPVIASHSCSREICNNPRNMSDPMLRELAKNHGVIQMCILSSYVKTPENNFQRDSAKSEVKRKYGDYYSLDAEGRRVFLEAWHQVDREFPESLATVSDVVDHIDHIVKVAGIDHVGIGTDFDGGGGVKDCYDVSEIRNITAELLRRGYNRKEINKIWGENLLRVFSEVEEISKKL